MLCDLLNYSDHPRQTANRFVLPKQLDLSDRMLILALTALCTANDELQNDQ